MCVYVEVEKYGNCVCLEEDICMYVCKFKGSRTGKVMKCREKEERGQRER